MSDGNGAPQETDALIVQRLTVTYSITADGSPDLALHWENDRSDLIAALGMLRLAEDTVIREAMGEIDGEDD